MLIKELESAKNKEYYDIQLEFMPNINLGISALVPKIYVSNSQGRLSFYKKTLY
jgi:transcription-repair coupling factor (superfamily II helicase)